MTTVLQDQQTRRRDRRDNLSHSQVESADEYETSDDDDGMAENLFAAPNRDRDQRQRQGQHTHSSCQSP